MFIALALIFGILMLVIYSIAKAGSDYDEDIGTLMTRNTFFSEEYGNELDDFYDEYNTESEDDEYFDEPDMDELDRLIDEFKEEFGDEYDFDEED
ncbi:MAG: hypothetical protein PUB67_03275 [Clostridiales bacterium]|nr:hypothetical protein [Clostridiales bacterium]